MKKLLLLIACVMVFLFMGCEPNAPATSSKVKTGAASDITTKSVVLHGVVNVDISQYEDVEFGMMVSDDKADLNARDGEMYKAKVLIGKDFELTLEGLSPETKYYYCAWILLNNTQYEFGPIKEFVTIKENAGNTDNPNPSNTDNPNPSNTDNPNPSNNAKAFSISDSKQVTFSKGNLQYHPANNEWRFAPSQLDYIGNANSNCSSIYNGWLDLFGWSTSATNFGVSTSTDYDYYGSFVDWGTNQIGSDAPNTWRTLTYNEWYHLRYDRTNADDLVGVAQVNGVNGLILLPDNWTCPAGVTFKSGYHSSSGVDYYAAYAAYQTFTAKQWSKLESAGAVFLPAAGMRDGSKVYYVQYFGYYWSATGSGKIARYLFFNSDEALMQNKERYPGQAVRLVKDL